MCGCGCECTNVYCTCMYTCLCMYVCVHVCTCVCVYMCMGKHVYVCIHVCMHMCVHIRSTCVHVCVRLCVYACLFVCVHMFVCTHVSMCLCISLHVEARSLAVSSITLHIIYLFAFNSIYLYSIHVSTCVQWHTHAGLQKSALSCCQVVLNPAIRHEGKCLSHQAISLTLFLEALVNSAKLAAAKICLVLPPQG